MSPTQLVAEDLQDFKGYIEWVDNHLDAEVARPYQRHPLAQDWARVAKVIEECGEAIAELIAATGQNPRKGVIAGAQGRLLGELADTALTAMYAIQHFTKDSEATLQLVIDKACYHKDRLQGNPIATV